jgi:enamine deaminase RidA (YjgF/YER057c/UK114 family)
MDAIAQRLVSLDLDLPPSNAPQGTYLPYVRTGSLVFIAGQGPRRAGELLYKGVVGADLSISDGQHAAHLCVLNILGHLRAACDGDLNRVVQFVRLAGLVRCTSDFEGHAKVLNGASDLVCEIFGDRGRHARIASGTHSLPSGMAVEIEAVVEIRQ